MDLSEICRELSTLREELRRSSIIQAAISLQQNDQSKKKTLEEWIKYVCQLRWRTVKIERDTYERQETEFRQRPIKRLSLDEAARMVTGLRRTDRAREGFRKFQEYLRQPTQQLMGTQEHLRFLDATDAAQSSGAWGSDVCLWLKDHYAKRQKLVTSQRAGKAAKNRRRKNSRKNRLRT
jgi:hypothetical protein